MSAEAARYLLLGADGRAYRSATPGTLGGHRRQRIYGRLDCPSALRALRRGGYVRDRVFFADEPTAVAAGYRPCAVCLPTAHRQWRRAHRPIPTPAPRPGREIADPIPAQKIVGTAPPDQKVVGTAPPPDQRIAGSTQRPGQEEGVT